MTHPPWHDRFQRYARDAITAETPPVVLTAATIICRMRSSNRPYVICHMLPSLDGRIVLRDWKLPNATREYEKTAATFEADAWIIGRISMEPYAGKARVPTRKRGL